MEQFSKKRKTLIGKRDKVRNESNKVQEFSRSVSLDQPPYESSYGTALEVLKTIFEASGQKHLVKLIQFRRIWVKEIGGFLARYSMPSKITVEESFKVGKDYFKLIKKRKIDKDLLGSLMKQSGNEYGSLKAFLTDLIRELGRKLTQEEIKLLHSHIQFIPVHTVLHLTVYDGSIAQAIQLEKEVYIERFNSKLPELTLGDIRCKVGDLGHSSRDQIDFDELCSIWDKLSPMDIFGLCRPYRIHRVNSGHAILILYCKHFNVMKRIQLNPGVTWMLRRIKELFPDFGETFQGLTLIYNNENKKIKNILENGVKFVPPPRVTGQTNSSLDHNSDEVLSEQDQLNKIIKKLRNKNK